MQHVGFPDLRPAARPFSELTFDAERQGLGAVRAHLAQLHGDYAHLEEALELCMPRDGESLAQLGERTGNRWTPEYTALMNDLTVDRTMEAGTLVKIARREQYRPEEGPPGP